MNARHDAGPLVYEILVEGELGNTVPAAFGNLRAESRGHHTVLRGSFPDEAAVHAALAQIQDSGFTVLGWRRHLTNSIEGASEGEP